MKQPSTLPADIHDSIADGIGIGIPAHSSGIPMVVQGQAVPAMLYFPRVLQAEARRAPEAGRAPRITLDASSGLPIPTTSRLIIPFREGGYATRPEVAVPPGIPDLVFKKFLEEVDGALKLQGVAFTCLIIFAALFVLPALLLPAFSGTRDAVQRVCNKYNKKVFLPKGILARAQKVIISRGCEEDSCTLRYWIALSLDPADSAMLRQEAEVYSCEVRSVLVQPVP